MQPIRFFTALRDDARRTIEHIGAADIVVGIPAFWAMESVEYVMQSILEGLEKHYPDKRTLVFIADGGSTDDTREAAMRVEADTYNVHVLVSVYRGLSGKGSAVRAIFEAADFLKADAVALFDSDLKSITPDWVKNVIEPVMEGYDFVAPDYLRHKFDGTITNTIAYNLTRALYGYRIRQPIGGDFGISSVMLKRYLQDDIWESDIARFGIDIWLTTLAIVSGARICQTHLGVKIHGEKDPAADLGPMFRQVVGTIFSMMEVYKEYWSTKEGSEAVPFYGDIPSEEPPQIDIDYGALIDYFKVGYANFSSLWKSHIDADAFETVSALAAVEEGTAFHMPTEVWVRIVYGYALLFHNTERQRFKILDTMIPLYYARVASLVQSLSKKDAREAETYYEAQAKAFERGKTLLLKEWNGENEQNSLNDYLTRIWQ
jgi:glucosylglycerate synthase